MAAERGVYGRWSVFVPSVAVSEVRGAELVRVRAAAERASVVRGAAVARVTTERRRQAWHARPTELH
ncbi:MAG: hypothetical protein JNM17_25015 [Archangium sp.]|nr:hypothetical protein [Archangium sp.]